MTRRTRLRDRLENPRLGPLGTTSNMEGRPGLVAVLDRGTPGGTDARRGGPSTQPEMSGSQASRTHPAPVPDAGHCQLAIVREDDAVVLRRRGP